MVRASTIRPLTEHFFNSHDLTNTREKLQGEESRLTHWRTGLGQGSQQSRCSWVRGLTANVKRRNLLRRTGLSRAAPDLMDSQICQKKEKHQGRCQGLLPPRHTWSCPAASPSCPQAQHHSSWAVTCVTTHSAPFTLPLPQPHSLQRLRKVREPRSLLSVGLSIRGGNQPVYGFVTSSNKYLLILNYRASTSGLQKQETQSPPSRSQQAVREPGVNVCTPLGSRCPRRRVDSSWEEPWPQLRTREGKEPGRCSGGSDLNYVQGFLKSLIWDYLSLKKKKNQEYGYSVRTVTGSRSWSWSAAADCKMF